MSEFHENKNIRQCNWVAWNWKSSSWAMKKNTAIILFATFFNTSKQFLDPEGLSAECVQVGVM